MIYYHFLYNIFWDVLGGLFFVLLLYVMSKGICNNPSQKISIFILSQLSFRKKNYWPAPRKKENHKLHT